MAFRHIQKQGDSELPAVPYGQCIAKTCEDGAPGLTVSEHCRIVGEVARRLTSLLPPDVASSLGNTVLTAALHDVGKVSPGFQLKYFQEHLAGICRELADVPNHFEKDHARTGGSAVWQAIGSPWHCPVTAWVAATHHGSVSRSPSPTDTAFEYGGEHWSLQRTELIEALKSEFGELDDRKLSLAQRSALAGLVTVADWIGSDETFFPPSGLSEETSIAETAARAVKTCGLRKPDIIPGLNFKDIFHNDPYDLQTQFADMASGPGLYILEAPMGMGKTEAALYAAYKLFERGQNTGLFFGLPTRLTSNRIHRRVKEFLEKITPQGVSPKLAHGTAWLNAFKSGGEELRPGSAWFNPRKRSLLHPFVVGTADQALLSVLRVRHHFVRTFALAGKVVILDEVHSYDGYTGTLLEALSRQLLEVGCTVIVLSATLTAERRNAFFSGPDPVPFSSAYPLISRQTAESTGCRGAEPPEERRHAIRIVDWDDHEVARCVVEKARAGHCVLAIANTVAQAQNWFDAVRCAMAENEFSTGLLHSKFPAFQRASIENDWLDKLGRDGVDRPHGCVLVATQVVEQSVDIDADFLITELAPTDMLLQRLGRQWRHERDNRPGSNPETVIVTGEPDAADSAEEIIEALGHTNSLVYAPYVLWRTYQVWQARSSVTLPTDIRELLESTYCTEPEGESEAVCGLRELCEARRDKLVQHAVASRAEITEMPTGQDREGISTRYSSLPTTQALIVQSLDSTGADAVIQLLDGQTVKVCASRPDIAVTAKLHDNLVSIATYLLDRIGAVETPRYLAKHFYESTPVLVWDSSSAELSLDGQSIGHTYTTQHGVARKKEQSSSRTYADEFDDLDPFDPSSQDW